MEKRFGDNTQSNLLKLSILLICVLGVLTWYANQDKYIQILGHSLQKSDELQAPVSAIETIPANYGRKDSPLVKVATSYGTKRRFLLLGDSQVEGLKNQVYDYCIENGHLLLCAVTWYSGTDKSYAEKDTISDIIRKFQPDYILFAIGLNQLYQKNMSESESAVKKLIAIFDTIPFCWIGPANFTTDKGINALYQRLIPADQFFLSKDLILARASDHRHPSREGYRVWMDTIANWLQVRSRWPIEMKKPDTLIKKREIRDIIFSGVE